MFSFIFVAFTIVFQVLIILPLYIGTHEQLIIVGSFLKKIDIPTSLFIRILFERERSEKNFEIITR